MKNSTLIFALSATLLAGCNSQSNDGNTNTVQESTIKSATTDENMQMDNETSLTVDDVFVRASFPGQSVAAAFFTLNNHSDKDLEVKSITSNVAGATEFHTMKIQDSKMIMRKMDKVIVPAKGKLVLSSGADHVMLLDLKDSLEVDKEVILNIEFTNGAMQEIKGIAQDMDTKDKDMEDKDMNKKEMNHETMMPKVKAEIETDHKAMGHE